MAGLQAGRMRCCWDLRIVQKAGEYIATEQNIVIATAPLGAVAIRSPYNSLSQYINNKAHE